MLDDVAAVAMKDVVVQQCGLEVVNLGRAASIDEAWRFLPDQGDGVVVVADGVRRHERDKKSGYLVEAEVSEGNRTTIVRLQGDQWHAWQWVEKSGDTHWSVERMYLSSEPVTPPLDCLLYRIYWTKVEDDGLLIWQPVGSRFCGFKETQTR